MADDFAVRGLREHRALPERVGQTRHAEGNVKALRRTHHLLRRIVLGLQGRIDIDVADARVRFHEVVQRCPALRPHVAEQMRRNRAVLWHPVLAVHLAEPGAHVTVQRVIQRLDLVPEPGAVCAEFRRRHVVVRAPHFADISITQFGRTLVGEFDEAGVLVAHGPGDFAPADPVLEQFIVVASVAHELFEFGAGNAVVLAAAILASTVDALHLGRDRGKLLALRCIIRRRGRRAEFEEVERAARGCVELVVFVGQCLLHRFAVPLRVAFAGSGRNNRGIAGDIGRADPLRGGRFLADVDKLVVDAGDEALRRFGRGRGCGRLFGRFVRTGGQGRCERDARQQSHKVFHGVFRTSERRASSDAKSAK